MKHAGIAALAALTLAACGGDSSKSSTSEPEATSTPYTANDPDLMKKVEREITVQLEGITAGKGEVTDTTVHCSPESDITFSCGGSADVDLTGGYCSTITIEYRGNVDPNHKGGGDYWDWKADPSTSESSEPSQIC